VRKLRAKGITISETPDCRDLKIPFEDNAVVDMLEFVEKPDIGKRPGADIKKVDLWDIERLDQSGEEGEDAGENGAE
jgi:hypothetical protein